MGSGDGFEGDAVAECWQLVDVAGFLAFGPTSALEKPDPRSWKWASGSDSRCQITTSTDRPTATMARFVPRRRAIRRYRSPGNVSVRPIATAISPSTDAS
jgi:hypothetical protein